MGSIKLKIVRKSPPSFHSQYCLQFVWHFSPPPHYRLQGKKCNLETVAAVSIPWKGFDKQQYMSCASSQGFNLYPITHPLACRDLVSVHKIRSIFRRQNAVWEWQILLVLYTWFVKPLAHNLVGHILKKGDLGLNSNSFSTLTHCFNPSALLHRIATISAAAANKQDQ